MPRFPSQLFQKHYFHPFSLALILVLLLPMFAACNGRLESTASTPTSTKKERFGYLISNNLELEYKEQLISSGEFNIHCYLASIKNTSNNKLYEKLNQTMLQDVKKAAIQIQTENEPTTSEAYTGMNVAFAANNLLSATFVSYGENPIPDYGMLYSLKDGTRLLLKDLFADGTDYVSLINRLIPPALLSGYQNEEDLLYKPFDTIKPDQDFALTMDTLYIIFAKGESGFVNRHSLALPLSELGESFDILDRLVDKTLLNSSGIKNNRIYIKYQGSIPQEKPFKIYTQGFVVSGLGTAFEKKLNTQLADELTTVSKLELAKLTKLDSSNALNDEQPMLTINSYPSFNQYGILCVITSAYSNVMAYQYYSKVICFDLKNQCTLDSGKLLLDWFSSNPDYQHTLFDYIKHKVATDFKENPEFVQEFDRKFNLELLKSKVQVYFNGNPYSTESYLVLRFQSNTFAYNANMLELMLPFQEALPSSPDAFFNR